MLSVDLGYGMEAEKAAAQDTWLMRKEKVDWPNVLLAGGFEEAQTRFNLDGYGLTLIGPDGRVKAVDIGPMELEEILDRNIR